jgi:hypothetical protein
MNNNNNIKFSLLIEMAMKMLIRSEYSTSYAQIK